MLVNGQHEYTESRCFEKEFGENCGGFNFNTCSLCMGQHFWCALVQVNLIMFCGKLYTLERSGTLEKS